MPAQFVPCLSISLYMHDVMGPCASASMDHSTLQVSLVLCNNVIEYRRCHHMYDNNQASVIMQHLVLLDIEKVNNTLFL